LTTKLGEGTFGEVHKAVHKSSGDVVALKRVLMHNEKEGLPITAIREIKLLKSLNHPNIVPLADMLVRHEGAASTQGPSVYMVFPYMEHDLTGLLENPKIQLRPEHIKLYLRQLLEGTAYLHASHVMHRDMKASNLLINNDGGLFIADFGLARAFNPDEKKDLTKCVVTRWYRPPELLLGERKYTTAIDVWGIGCIFAEMLIGKPVFQGSTDLNQIDQVMRVCGSPNDTLWPGWRDLPDCRQVEGFGVYPRRVRDEFARFGEEAADLLDMLLQLDPRRRPTAAQALKHRLFFTAPFPARPEDMPTFEHSHEFDRRKHRSQRPRQSSQGPAAPPQPPANHQQQHPPPPPPLPQPETQRNGRRSDSHQPPYSPARRRARYDSPPSRSSRNDRYRDGDGYGGTSHRDSRRTSHHPYHPSAGRDGSRSGHYQHGPSSNSAGRR
ncbi:serine/threonine protein kinase, CMGC, CDC2/CDK sub, partial [Coemansia spiralis]